MKGILAVRQRMEKMGIPKAEARVLSLRLRLPGKAEQMMEELKKNPEATVDEIWDMVEEIQKPKNQREWVEKKLEMERVAKIRAERYGIQEKTL